MDEVVRAQLVTAKMGWGEKGKGTNGQVSALLCDSARLRGRGLELDSTGPSCRRPDSTTFAHPHPTHSTLNPRSFGAFTPSSLLSIPSIPSIAYSTHTATPGTFTHIHIHFYGIFVCFIGYQLIITVQCTTRSNIGCYFMPSIRDLAEERV